MSIWLLVEAVAAAALIVLLGGWSWRVWAWARWWLGAPRPRTMHWTDLTAVRLGVRRDGLAWTVRLRGSHVLLAGATGAGKSNVLWALLHQLAPMVRCGLVELWVIDPKGGLELAAGAPLFARFACDEPAGMADLLDDAVALMRERTQRLRGHVRQHTPSRDEPLIVVLVDEVAALTAYAPADVKKRVTASLGLLLTQGRAVGVTVVAAVQDPRKETLPLRDLFTIRVCLRVIEAPAVDLVLGDGAHERGAVCEQIPERRPGVGYMLVDGTAAPLLVRAAHVTDQHVAALAASSVADAPVIAEAVGEPL